MEEVEYLKIELIKRLAEGSPERVALEVGHLKEFGGLDLIPILQNALEVQLQCLLRHHRATAFILGELQWRGEAALHDGSDCVIDPTKAVARAREYLREKTGKDYPW